MKKLSLRFTTLFLCLFLACKALSAAVNVGSLTTERLTCPLGIDTQNPRLSWIITSDKDGVMQTARRILVASSPELLREGKADIWDSGRVESDASVLVPYDGKPLAANRRYYWAVKVYTTRGESPWSEPAEWGTGPVYAR